MPRIQVNPILKHAGPSQQATTEVRCVQVSSKETLILVWMVMGVLPMTLQIRSYAKFVTPHKITAHLIAPEDGIKYTSDIWRFCPVKECWCVLESHADSLLSQRRWLFVPLRDSTIQCTWQLFRWQPYNPTIFHKPIRLCKKRVILSNTISTMVVSGIIRSMVKGTYCPKYAIAYVRVGGLGTLDINGPPLANDGGDTGYRRSYWYACTVALWITVRCWILRRSYVVCIRFARRNDQINKRLGIQDAMIFVQESMRLSAHGAKNYQRVGLAYLLVEGLMSDLFLLTTQEGVLGRLQCISLGYNLAGIMSMLFEMIESMHWLRERNRCFFRRVLFNHETMLVGELMCAGGMQFFVTSLNRSSLEE
ncbi:LOW QUALITY PROTEIN: Hypothetical protein PHPALM_13581 [Phytophthora palmivora]|uniref:Uncharacterized protein n=1 Tax=Phytophthora palmivora TaxID=4796 RepID=A0A2P4XWV5_9STRA|nr:LOW QUALITY PROTEIN: Hypothetical protein PHPALM_13581 [Phytophthora palmivora]